MVRFDNIGFRAIFSLLLIVGLLNIPAPAYSQDGSNLQNLMLNGGFEEGFQEEFGVGYGWGGFSNGNALVGWNADTWDAVVAAGQNAQMIEIKDATELNRYAGIYQTVSVVPGEQYKLTIRGLVRSSEGDIILSDYGYRLQYAIDDAGGSTWELLPDSAWIEIPWDEQPLNDPPAGVYRLDTYEATVTAKSDKLTLFVRGWKKWINNGSGIFDLDEISLIGPAPETFELQAAQPAVVGNPASLVETEADSSSPAAPISEEEVALAEAQAQPQTETAPVVGQTTQEEPIPQAENSQLPVSGQGKPDALNFIVIIGAGVLLVLVVGAITAMKRQGSPVE